MSSVEVVADARAIGAAAARRVAEAAARSIAERGRFVLVLAGGSTPRGLYEELAAARAEAIHWGATVVFWGDERAVPPEHPESNFRMAREALLDRVSIPHAGVHRMRGELGAEAAAAEYAETLARFFGTASPAGVPGEGGFDLVLLGIGADGHTASLFPGCAALRSTAWAAAALAPPSAAVRERITLSLPAIGTAREVLFLAAGADKRAAVAAALGGSRAADPVPAGSVTARGATHWIVDAAADPR